MTSVATDWAQGNRGGRISPQSRGDAFQSLREPAEMQGFFDCVESAACSDCGCWKKSTRAIFHRQDLNHGAEWINQHGCANLYGGNRSPRNYVLNERLSQFHFDNGRSRTVILVRSAVCANIPVIRAVGFERFVCHRKPSSNPTLCGQVRFLVEFINQPFATCRSHS